jgi:predicted secreted Zn-dependent protease
MALGLAFFKADAGPPPGPGEMVDLTIEYYDVSGRTPAEINAAGSRSGPIDPKTGRRVVGYTAWHLDWDAPGGPGGPCRLDQAWVSLDITVTLPRLVETETTPPALLERWRPFVAGIRTHEMTHARIAREGREAMLRAIQRADCATAPRAARDAAVAIQRRSDDYDRAAEDARFR